MHMKKIIFSIIIVITLVSCILGGTEANSQVKAKLTSNQNNIEKGKEILITLGYDKCEGISDGINVYKAKLEYNDKIFEEVLEKDFKTLNNWTEFKYNKNTKEFIAIKKDGSKIVEDVIQITLKTKNEINLKQTNVKIKDIIVSEGKIDINIDEVSLKLNISENETTKDDEQNTQKENEVIKNESVQNNQNNTLDLEKKEEEKEDLFLGIFPNLGDSNFRKIILTLILIFTTVALNYRNKYKKIDKKKTRISIIALIITLSTINHSAEIYANNTNLKGYLNNDLKIDYEDVKVLEEHLIHIKNLENDKINDADMNGDNNITVTDLSLLVKYIEENKDFVETPEITNSEYRNTTSMYSWKNQTLVKDADIIYKALNELNVNTLYQSINSSYMKKEYIEDIIKSYTANGIEVHRLIGDPSWAYDNTSAKNKIDEIDKYNKTVDECAKIKGVNLDIEPHVDDRWDVNPQNAFTLYKNTMIDLYNYAKQYNLHVTICTNVWFSKYEGFEELYEKAADTYSIMNYVKNTNVSGIKEEIEIAEKYNKKIETIAHSSIDSEETESYHNDGMDKLVQDQENILENYPYGNLRPSYHHFTTIEYLKEKFVYLDLKLTMTDNSNIPTDLKLITPDGKEKTGYIVKLGKEQYYMFPRLGEKVKYKVKSDTHQIIDNDTLIIPNSPKGRAELEIKVKKKLLRSSEQIGIGGCGCTNTPTISPFDSKTMITLTDMGGFFVSNNGGENWKRIDTKGVVNSVTFDSNKEGVIYVGGSGLYKSIDNGKTFEMIYPNKDKIIAEMNRFEDGKTFYYTKEGYETFKPIRNIAIDSKDSNHIFIAQYDFNNGVILESKDGGKSFERLYEYSTKADDYVTKMFVEDDGLIHMTIEEIYKYNFETKKETKIFTADVKIMDIVKVEDTFLILEQTETTYENYEKVKTKVRYTKNFVDFTDITKDIINGINNSIKDYKNTTEDIYGVDYDNLNFKLNFKYLDATSLDNIYFTNVRCDQNLADYQYYDCVLNYNKGKVNFIYGYPFKTSKSLVNPGSPFIDDIYDMFGVCVDKKDKDSVLFTTLGGIYYYNNGKLYQRNTVLVEEKDGTKTYVNNGMNMHTTYSLKKDPLNPSHQLLLNTDLGLTHSYNGGKTWVRSHEGIKHEWINTIYDLEFDKEKEGVAYSVWSSRHDAPYLANEDETTNVYGGFAISYDSGNTWDSNYSTGLPEHINPVKISVVYNKDSEERTIYLTSFNFGNYVSYDSGKTFTELNNGIPRVNNNKYIFGGDILAADGKVFMLTARTVYNNEEQKGKVYELIDNSWKELKLNENVRCPRDLYYHNGELYISATASYKYDWTIPDVEYRLVGGGIHKYDGKEVKQVCDETLSIGGIQIDSKGNLYASDLYGNIYIKNYEFNFHKIYSNYHFRSKGLTLYEEDNKNILYLATFGGGMLKVEVNK